MTQADLTKLFRYFNEKFDAIDRRLAQTASKADVEVLVNAIDGLYALYDRVDSEQTAQESHLRRLDDQIKGHAIRLRVLEQL